MNFSVIIGNPPYQVPVGNDNGYNPIYHHFIDSGKILSSHGTLIHPGRFLFRAGKTPKDWNEKILNDEHLRVIRYFPSNNEIFPETDIKGGVAVTHWNRKKIFGKISTFIPFPELRSIFEKVTGRGKSLSELINTRSTRYDFTALFRDFPHLRKNFRDKYVETNAFENHELFSLEPGEGKLAIHGLIKNKRTIRWIPLKYLEPNPLFDKYKVLLPKANGSGALGETLSTPMIGNPIQNKFPCGFTRSFLAFGPFSSLAESESCLKYLKTKFARAMLGTLKITQHNNRNVWKNVPLQNFTENSDIDWTKSISEIDQQLYAKYGLDEDEIQFIETHIKEMA